jgi:hypothetical protein
MFTVLLKTFCLCFICNNQLRVIDYQSYASLSQHKPFPRALYRQHLLRGIINLVLRAFLGYPWLPQICSKNATVRRTLTQYSSSYARCPAKRVARSFVSARAGKTLKTSDRREESQRQ